MTRLTGWFTALLMGTATLSCLAVQPASPMMPTYAAAAPIALSATASDPNAPLRDSLLNFAQVAPSRYAVPSPPARLNLVCAVMKW